MSNVLEEFAIKLNVDGASQAAGDVGKLDKAMGSAEGSGNALDVAVGNLAADIAGKLLDALKDAVKWVLDLVPAFAGLGDEIAKTSKAIDVNATELQRLRYAGQRSGVEISQLDDSLAKLRLQLEQARITGTGPLADAFGTLGLSIDEVTGLGAEDQLGMIADALKELEDPAQRAAVTMTLFGDGNKRMKVLLDEGSAGIRKLGDEVEALGGVIGDEALVNAEALSDQMLNLETVVGGLKTRLAQELAPSFSAAIDGLIGMVDANRDLIDGALDVVLDTIMGAAEALAPALEGIADVLRIVLPLVGEIVTAVMPAIEALGELAGNLIKRLTPSIEKLKEALGPLIEILGERLVVAVEMLEGPIMTVAGVVEFFVDVLVLWIDAFVTIYRWLEDTAGILEERFPKAFEIAKKVVSAFIHPVDTARKAVAAVFDWIEKAVSKIGWLADKIKEIRRSLGLGTGERVTFLANTVGRQAKPPAEKAEETGKLEAAESWNTAQAKAERARRRAEVEADRANKQAGASGGGGGKKGGRGGGPSKPKGGGDSLEDLLGLPGASSIPDVLGGGARPGGPSLIRIDASYNAPTTINVEIHGVDLGDEGQVEGIRKQLAGELGADLAERDRRAYDRYREVLV